MFGSFKMLKIIYTVIRDIPYPLAADNFAMLPGYEGAVDSEINRNYEGRYTSTNDIPILKL